jgi:hypothetical protein
MVRKIAFLFFLAGALVLSEGVPATEAVPMSCLPAATSLQAFDANAAKPSEKKIYPLTSLKWDQVRETPVQAEVFYNQEKGGLEISIFFKDPEAMSLPYNLYAVLVTTESGRVIWRDFTDACKEPGLSFFPGRRLQLEPFVLKLQPQESYRVMIWGRM